MRKIIQKTSCLLRVTLWIFFLVLLVQAQNLHQWGNVSLFHGLPSDKVHAITQTPDGIFWFGTENGLAKFDGRRVQTIPLEEVTQIFSLAVGNDGTLFVGTNYGAFYSQQDKFLSIENLRGRQINGIFSAEKTYFAAQDGEVFVLENNSAKSLFKLDIPITSVIANGEQIFVGTEGRGLIRFENGQTNTFVSNTQPYFVNDLAFDANATLWLGGQANSDKSGLFHFGFQRFSEQFGKITSLKFDAKNDLWFGTKENGVFRFRNGETISHFRFENTSGGLRSNQIFDVFVDREGVIWFGTDKGVCRFDGASPLNYTFSEDSNSNFVRTLYRANDSTIYAGTNKGLYTFDGKNWLASEKIANKSIYSIGESVDNQLLIGTSGDDTRSIQNFKGKTYTAIFGKGLLENESLIFSHNSIITLFVERDKLFIGTANDGLYLFDGKEVKPLEKLKGETIRQIEGIVEKGLWIATEKGLHLWQGDEIKAFIENHTVRSLLLRDNEIYAGTKDGGLFLGKFDDEFGWIFSNLSVEQGLPGPGVFAMLNLGDEILIGTNRGISRYSPNKFSPSIVPNRIISERVHSAKEIAEGIKLDYPQNTLTVEVTGLSSRTFPESFQYGYLLKNSKGETVLKKLTKDSQILFENLAAGNYSAEIYTFNQDLLKSEPFKFKFSVGKAPFPWTSTALAILLVIAVTALIMAIMERRQIAAKNKEIAAARFNLANEAERERRRIARDLHDQTLADLRKLMLKSDKLEGETAEFRSEIESVSDEIRRICEDLSPSVLENVGLTAALEFLLSNTFESYNLLCAEGLEERLGFSSNIQMQIYRIAQEVLNNIKRHAEANFVEMKISDEDGFKLIIENDGIEFLPDFENLPKGRGISNIKARAELIEATISWESSEDGKTIFSLQK